MLTLLDARPIDDVTEQAARAPSVVETVCALRRLPPFRYRAGAVDCPWAFETWSAKGKGKSADRHYPTMKTDDLCRLPIGQLFAADAGIIVWATAPMIKDALRCLDAWGFRYVSMGAWGKMTQDGEGPAFGTGYWFRSAAEFYILGLAGDISPAAHDVRNLILAPRREHSRKPDEIYRDIERIFPGGPYIDIFARQRRPGWDAFGLDADQFEAAP